MALECTGADENGICEACQQAQDFADKLYKDMVLQLKSSGLSDMQAIQAAVNASLWCVESIANNQDTTQESTGFAASIVTEWYMRMDTDFNSNNGTVN